MTWDDAALHKKGHADEERWARKQDSLLIEEAQRATREQKAQEEAREEARKALRTETGLADPELEELESLGFTPDTVSLLPLVPVIQVAWADGGVTSAEREALLDLARKRGIEAGSRADTKLEEWLSHRPEEKVFACGLRYNR